MGEAPPALQLAAYCTAENVIGIFHQTGSNYLLRVRAGYAGSIISHLLSQIAGRMLRDAEGVNARIFLDRNIRGASKRAARGQGNKGRGKGAGEAKVKAKAKGREKLTKGNGTERDRSPRRGAAAPEPVSATPPAAEAPLPPPDARMADVREEAPPCGG